MTRQALRQTASHNLRSTNWTASSPVEYGVDPERSGRRLPTIGAPAHQPFHWFVEFYGIMTKGGFDVVIGNPPWRGYSSE